MERSKEKSSLRPVLGKRLEQIFCRDSTLVVKTTMKVYLNIGTVLMVFSKW